VDSPDDAIRRVTDAPIDVLIVDASVTMLTPEVLALVPRRVGRIVALAETETATAWATSLGVLDTATTLAEARTRIGATIVPPPAAVRPSALDESAQVNESRPNASAVVIAVWGPVGAPGITTAAVSLAMVSALAGQRVLLCDADTRGASVAIALGIADEVPGLAAACRLAAHGELTHAELERLAARVDRSHGQLSVLTGLPRSTRWPTLDPLKLRDVLAIARELYDTIVVDVGFGIEENEWVDDAPQRDGAAREVLRSADTVVAVGRADAVAIARLIRALDEARDLCARPVVVLNGVTARDAREASAALERFTDHTVRAVVTRDSRGGVEEAATRAVNSQSWRRVADVIGIPSPTAKARRHLRR
jgi:MinD-like ATPase involved in chromosome partitioning or flagellar assembly